MTRRMVAALAALSFLLTACGKKAAEPGMGEMTPEEHARMQAGGTQGKMDTSGMAVRQAVHLTAEQELALGVVYTQVNRETLSKTVRTVGVIQTPEPNIADVTPKIEGFVEKLLVNTTGETVRRGQPLLSLYSPMLVAAQEELLTAKRLASGLDSSSGEAWQSAQAMLVAARRRLAYWDITDDQIAQLERSGTVTKTLTLASPVNGIVLEKHVLEGQRVMPGERLYRIGDLSEVWVEGEVFEQDIPLVKTGMQVHIEIAARPGEHLMGRVSFIYPTIDASSRTNRVRLTVPNPGLLLKPGMFATIFFDATIGRNVIAVPRAAVIVTGQRNLVFVRDAEGMLQPREVVLGARSADRVQILSGLAEGETIVASANFLVDAESRLGSSGGGMPGMQHGAAEPPPGEPAREKAMPEMAMPAMPMPQESAPPMPEHRHDQ
ncbi:MAG: efflux RND transporter periplasmic adaptor subunit [Gemmatimonadales bacterium]|nr:MAG: efflux RND transporter periplasmic adaptor subunit [Gemmatimonadales bacterium]